MDYRVEEGTVKTLKWLNIFNLFSVIFTLVLLTIYGTVLIGLQSAFLVILRTGLIMAITYYFTFWAKNKFIEEGSKSSLYIAIGANILGLIILNRIVSIIYLATYFKVMFKDRIAE